jgi:hypothetical protein|tara:strand:+ start:2036 stop:2674 length:639 start_codon:yes stop_codon:yes gene_type:complete
MANEENSDDALLSGNMNGSFYDERVQRYVPRGTSEQEIKEEAARMGRDPFPPAETLPSVSYKGTMPTNRGMPPNEFPPAESLPNISFVDLAAGRISPPPRNVFTESASERLPVPGESLPGQPPESMGAAPPSSRSYSDSLRERMLSNESERAKLLSKFERRLEIEKLRSKSTGERPEMPSSTFEMGKELERLQEEMDRLRSSLEDRRYKPRP